MDPGDTLLVLGGARSGKSRHAQARAEAGAKAGAGAGAGTLVYVATAQAFDAEMADRIARHRGDRDARWRTLEAPLDLLGAIDAEDRAGAVLLVDCLTLWTSNLLLAGEDAEAAAGALAARMARLSARLVLVSNEVGWGIVPDNALARRFRDVAGLVNQRIAAAAACVELVVAGLPLRLK